MDYAAYKDITVVPYFFHYVIHKAHFHAVLNHAIKRYNMQERKIFVYETKRCEIFDST